MLQTKALYNLLRLNAAEDPAVSAEQWAIEDLRKAPIEELFSRLEQKGVKITRHAFHQFADQCDTPEELTELLLPDDASEQDCDPFYLAVFELWRRLVPEKRSLSIFCDDLDYHISLYDEAQIESDEPIQDGLANLLEILDENADLGADPQEVFQAITQYCAHDLESFIADYISDLLDNGNCLYASELVEGFSPYISDPLWFDFLRVRLISSTDIGEANIAMHRLLKNELELPLLLEAIRFLSAEGDHQLFKLALRKAIPLLDSQDEMLELIGILADFYRRLDEDENEQKVQKILLKGKSKGVEASDLKTIQELIE